MCKSLFNKIQQTDILCFLSSKYSQSFFFNSIGNEDADVFKNAYKSRERLIWITRKNLVLTKFSKSSLRRLVHFFRTVFLSPMMVLLLFNLILYHFTKKKKNIQKIIIKNSSSMTRLFLYMDRKRKIKRNANLIAFTRERI